MTQEDSPEFRLHVRNLLHDYCLQHCTTDYVTFTEDLVAEFIEGLQSVPLTDPYSLTIAVHPYETFSQLHKLPTLPPYDEILQTTNDALRFIKSNTKTATCLPKTERIIWDDDYGLPPLREPIYTALSRKTRLNTKKLGCKGPQPASTYMSLIESQAMKPLVVEPVPEPELDIEVLLNLKCQIEPDELPAVRALLKSTADMLRHKAAAYKSKYVDPTYLRNTLRPVPAMKEPEEIFMPIFPRHGRGTTTTTSKPFNSFKDLVRNPSIGLQPIYAEDPDGDISRQNLVVVDGWETIRSSPLSTPSSKTSEDGDQADQLLFPSSPEPELSLVQAIEVAKMDDILIPRSRQIGGSSGVGPHILRGKTLETFLKPLLSLRPIEKENAILQASQSLEGISLVGQPPSTLNDENAGPADHAQAEGDEDLDRDLQRLYNGHELENFIVNETLDDNPSMLMEVPDLPPPREFPRNGIHLPTSFCDFLVPPLAKGDKKQLHISFPVHQFLKKAKGCQSLGLALSWVPFTTDKKLPTVLEIVDVVDLFPKHQLDVHSSANVASDHEEAVKLLESVMFEAGRLYDVAVQRILDNKETPYHLPESDEGFQILMNRQERHRLARAEGRAEDHETDAEDIEGNDCQTEGNRGGRRQQGIGLSGRRFYDYLSDDSAEEAARSKKRPRIDLDIGQDPADLGFVSHLSGADEEVHPGLASEGWTDVGYPEEEKEFCPPLSSSQSINTAYGSDAGRYPPMNLADSVPGNGRVHIEMQEDKSFEPLSFGTLSVVHLGLSQPGDVVHDESFHNPLHLRFAKRSCSPMVAEDKASPNQHLDVMEPDMASHSLGIFAFAQLRARNVSRQEPVVPSAPDLSIPFEALPCRPRGPPPEIIDEKAIRLLDNGRVAQSTHKYMASLDLIQRHALVCALRSPGCSIKLIERENLGEVDLILDPCTAIIFFSLFDLPARCDACVQRVSQQTWNFSRILIIFEAFPPQNAKKKKSGRTNALSTESGASNPYAYTPPILKAIKKFKRDLDIADACGPKNPQTLVNYAFADTVDEAALFTRLYGDEAEANDETEGAIWGARAWLEVDYSEDEETSLAAISGINKFSASIILCQVSLQDFVDMSHDERLQGFGGYIDPNAIMACNLDLESRFSAIDVSSGTLLSDLDVNDASSSI